MNKKFIVYSIILSACLSTSKAHDTLDYSADTRLSENQLEHTIHYHHGHDELDTMCEQLELQDPPTNRVAEFALSIACAAYMQYYSCKEFITDSWHSFKKKFVRKK